jgi:hypothetical protein
MNFSVASNVNSIISKKKGCELERTHVGCYNFFVASNVNSIILNLWGFNQSGLTSRCYENKKKSRSEERLL